MLKQFVTARNRAVKSNIKNFVLTCIAHGKALPLFANLGLCGRLKRFRA